jgi:pyruvate-ferredoxin/flavodoxin oxidoreductase
LICLRNIVEGGTFLLNSPYGKADIWDKLPRIVQEDIIDKKINFYAIDAYKVAKETGMGSRMNTILQTCFFAISGVLPSDEAIGKIKYSIQKTYGIKGDEIVNKNFNAVDKTLENLFKVEVPLKSNGTIELPPIVPSDAPNYVKNVLSKMISGNGDEVSVSEMPIDGTFASGTSQWEKRNIALQIPEWDESICIQCGKCAMICPHATIRIKTYDKKYLENAPAGFKYMKAKGKEFEEDTVYTIQVAAEDCTGCTLCYEICPVKNKSEVRLKALNMIPQLPVREKERANWNFFKELPEYDRTRLNIHSIKDSQILQPLFEFSGACSGCGETPYIKLATQLFGDRMIIANATGCSSIYGGNLPTTPYTINIDGKGPAWNNSLFEDNAEFGLGMRLSIDKHFEYAAELLITLSYDLGEVFVSEILHSPQKEEIDIARQRERISLLKEKLKTIQSRNAEMLLSVADYLVRKSVWIIGGDGWAYDIGYGGLDHVLASGKNVNMLVLDTEVYSNTGGQMSKSTGIGAVAKFASNGKSSPKKDLGLLAMSYGNVYVARVAMGANDLQTLKAFLEAEAYDGPSLIIAYSHCIAHGINMEKALDSQKGAVDSGYWQLFRYNPDSLKAGENPFKLDSKPPKIKFEDYAYRETRYKMLTKSHPEHAKDLLKLAQEEVNKKWKQYAKLEKEHMPETKTETKIEK